MELKLNVLLSDFVVTYHKIQNFHWYTKGANFFLIHEKLDELYDGIVAGVDEVAETMMMLELKPVASLKEFLEMSSIKEITDEMRSADDIMTHVLADFEHLLAEITVIKIQADEENIFLVSALMDEYMAQFSKSIWMVKQTLKK
ncbi:MAG: DNA starvation/stationary phase protection protein [Rikenellaceae bacterium]